MSEFMLMVSWLFYLVAMAGAMYSLESRLKRILEILEDREREES